MERGESIWNTLARLGGERVYITIALVAGVVARNLVATIVVVDLVSVCAPLMPNPLFVVGGADTDPDTERYHCPRSPHSPRGNSRPTK